MSVAEVKVALVTGSSSGIGEATVYLFAKKGFKVVVCGSNEEKVKRVVEECAKLSAGGRPMVHGLVLNFSEPANGGVAVEKTVEHFGRLDVLVNNAGIFNVTPYDQPKLAYETYKDILDINVDATVRATLAAVSYLRKSKGNLIFVSSVASTRPHANTFAYCMSKSAMSMLGKCFALDLAPDVRVNTVSPGPVKTSIMDRTGMSFEVISKRLQLSTLQSRVGESSEVASLIYYLVSDEANFITGQEIFIDGGYMLKMFSSVHQSMK